MTMMVDGDDDDDNGKYACGQYTFMHLSHTLVLSSYRISFNDTSASCRSIVAAGDGVCVAVADTITFDNNEWVRCLCKGNNESLLNMQFMKTYYSIATIQSIHFKMHIPRIQAPTRFLFFIRQHIRTAFNYFIFTWFRIGSCVAANNNVPPFLMPDKVGEREWKTHFPRLIHTRINGSQKGRMKNLFFCLLHGISRGKSSEKYVLVVSVSFFCNFSSCFFP